MRYIDRTASRLGPSGSMSAQSAAETVAARLYAERMAEAHAPEPPYGAGYLIVPTIFALGLAGWLLSILAVLYVVAPIVGAAFLLLDQVWSVSPTDLWHGR